MRRRQLRDRGLGGALVRVVRLRRGAPLFRGCGENWMGKSTGNHGIYSDLMGFYSDSMGFYSYFTSLWLCQYIAT